MKKKFLTFILTALCVTSFSLGFAACKQYTFEDNFNEWISGRNDALSTDFSTYTVKNDYCEYVDGELCYKYSDVTASTGEKYFYKDKEEWLDDNGEWLTREYLDAVKQVTDGSSVKTKFYTYEKDDKNIITESASYEWPETVNEYKSNFSLSDYIGYYYITQGNTWQTLQAHINSCIKEYYKDLKKEQADSVTLSRNDGSVALEFTISYQNKDVELNDVDGYISTKTNERYVITVKNGKIVSFEDDISYKHSFTDENDDYIEKTYDKTSISYMFDYETYDSISVDTQTTENHLFGTANIFVEGVNTLYYDKLVGETLTLSDIQNSINGNQNFLIANDDKTQYYQIYTDAQFTQQFTQTEMTKDLNLYLKFVVPESMSVVEVYYTNGEKTKIHLIYAKEADSEFNVNAYSDYELISIDGDTTAETLTCVEGTIHKIIFNVGNLSF